MKTYNCIIVDDDLVARLKVQSIAKNFPILNIVGSFSSAINALEIAEKQDVDILFLDIDMPNLNGLEFRKKLMNIPVCVFITSHPEHAVESFELDTLDFIVKPLRQERFEQTLKRIEEYLEIKEKAKLFETSFGDDFIYIKDGYDKIKIKLHDILYIEALKDYTLLITSQKRHCVFSGIGNLLKEDTFKNFIRVHRSFAVQKHFIEKVGTQNLTLFNSYSIPIGNSYKENLVNFYEN
jgi:two-component system LytT family response regulator